MMYFVRWLLPLFLAACAGPSLAQLAPTKTSYLYQIHESPVLSSDGGTILAAGADGPWIWHPGYPAQTLIRVPPSYHVGGLAISANGLAAAIVLEPDGANLNPPVYHPGLNVKLFLWTVNGGLKVLPPLPATDYLGGLTIRDSGNAISFWCLDQSSRPCAHAPFAQSGPPSSQKLWTSGVGYKNLEPLLAKPYEIIHVAGDFRSYLLATSSESGCVHAVLESGGRLSLLSNPHQDHNCEPIVASDQNRFFAGKSSPLDSGVTLWDSAGQLVTEYQPLSGCRVTSVDAVDDTGTIFGQEMCSVAGKGEQNEGVRITSKGTETISSWLEEAGLGTSLPSNIIADAVSGNGKTLIGSQFDGIAVSAGSNKSMPPTPQQNTYPNGPPGSVSGFVSGIGFIAHVP